MIEWKEGASIETSIGQVDEVLQRRMGDERGEFCGLV